MVEVTQADECTCMEVLGEDPRCKLHGFATDWRLENNTPRQWQEDAISVLSDLDFEPSHRLASQQPVPNSVVEDRGICSCYPLSQSESEYSLTIKMQPDGSGRVHCDECGKPMSPTDTSRTEYIQRIATLSQQSGQTEAASAECFAGSAYDYTGPPLNPPRLQKQTEAELLRECRRILPDPAIDDAHPRTKALINRIDAHLNATQGEGA